MDATALMTLVDRWRPETHMFHLPSGEITMMLQDIAMILGLPINANSCLWDGVSCRVEGLHWIGDWPSTP
jgi:hypothetical protein